MAGVRYAVDLATGQKTGFYLDQRDNRRAVAAYARGRRVLDLFCYTGGFGLNALMHGGATSSLGIDASRTAIDLARQNAATNGVTAAEFEAADVFDTLEALRAAGESFGLVICDPPKFAKHPRAVDDAIKGYLRLNRAAVSVLEPGGILVTCSCSGLVDRGIFADILGQSRRAGGSTDPDPRTARAGGRSPDLGILPRNRIPQVRDRPGLVKPALLAPGRNVMTRGRELAGLRGDAGRAPDGVLRRVACWRQGAQLGGCVACLGQLSRVGTRRL